MSAPSIQEQHERDRSQLGPFSVCPDCGSHTEPVADGSSMYCGICDSHWRFTLGWVVRVPNPEADCVSL